MTKKDTFVRGLFLSFLLVGIWLRWENIDKKVYWHDEVFTSLRTAGYTGEEVVNELFTGEILSRSDLLRYQTLSSNTDFGQTIAALKTHPEHPPLYYILVRFWQDWFGSSIATMRSLSVIFSLLVFPALYWFCYVLFQSDAVALMAVLLMTVSPFHVIYAQEARQYSLWTLTLLLTYGSFWQAVHQKHKFHWLTFGVTTILSLYTKLFTVLGLLATTVYLFWREKRFYTKVIRNYFLVLLGSAIAFLPWVILIITKFEQLREKTAWTEAVVSSSFLVKLWGLHFSSLLIDLGLSLDHPYTYLVPPLILVLIGYGLLILRKHNKRDIFLFLLCLLLIPSLSLILPDVILGGRRSTMTRYFIPSLISAQVIIAYLFTSQIHQKVWQGLVGFILILGLISSWKISQAEVWWNKTVSQQNINTATIINQVSEPLIISTNKGETNLGDIFSLAHYVEPETKFQLFQSTNETHQIKKTSSTFLYKPSVELTNIMTQQHPVQIIQYQKLPLSQVVWKSHDSQDSDNTEESGLGAP
ncbi:hypothetical protein PCC7418_2620 [Halothece sp. PCC 7418]|uniref:glycosyltransferase family 39 protein n=1 Tax=Halothece sp. (strain PCC 7418) TaxID=65093 RepID=UPI0002A08771|nr:glycosyltransferase family 39 protein [Halothece sp. PCC 7418]AFZ44762.1 hypothetical protein PCC7418_2620 [Halothece sp. PCC 7418]